jgi:hypothetical protein
MKNRLLFTAGVLALLLGSIVSCNKKTTEEENPTPVEALQQQLSFDYYGQEFTVPVTGGQDVRTEISADWIHTSGVPVDGTLSISIEQNYTKDSREGLLTILSDNQPMNYLVIQRATTRIPDTREGIKESEKRGKEVADAVQSILSKYSDDTPAATIAAEITQLDDVIMAKADEEGENIRFMKRDSTFTTVVLHPERYGIHPGSKGKTRQSVSRPKSGRIGAKSLPTKKALLLQPFYSDGIGVDFRWMDSQLLDVGVRLDYYLDDKADLPKFCGDSLAKYDLVLLYTHGGLWEKPDYSDKQFLIVVTGQSEWPDDFEPELYSKIETMLIKGGSSRYVVNRRILEATTSPSTYFNSTVVYFGACHSYSSTVDDFHNFFMLKKKAIGYYGYSHTMDVDVATGVLESLVRSFVRGMTVVKAFNYTKEDPELYTASLLPLLNKYDKRFCWDTKVAKYTLVDPTPFGLDSKVQGNEVKLTWDVTPTKGAYQYTVLANDNEYPAGNSLSISIPAGQEGQHDWYVRADLYIGQKFIQSYTSDKGSYQVTDSPFFTVTTGTPTYVFKESATIPVSYETNQNLHVFSGGVVFSSYQSEPALGRAYCQYIYNAATTNPFSVKVEPLNPGTTYYARAYVVTGESASTPQMDQEIHYGEVVSFETSPDANYPTFSGLEVWDESFNVISSIDFGQVSLGESPSLKLYLINRATHDIPVKVKSISEGFHIDLQSEEIIHPNNGIVPVLTFHPTQGKYYSGSVIFDLGEYYYPIEVKLSGTGVPLTGELTFSTNSLTFGPVEVGGKAQLPIVISNIGKQTVFITGVTMPDEAFICTFNGPLPVAAGAEVTLEIVFKPTAAKYYNGNVVIHTDMEEPNFKIAVEGTGTISTVAVTRVSLDKTELMLTVGSEQTLKATVYPTNATNKNVRWKSSDPTVAKVDDSGTVTALKPGTSTIAVTTEDGAYTASCLVSVKQVDGQHEGTVGEEWDN